MREKRDIKGWGFIAPGLLWIIAFFSKSLHLKALVNSLEVTLITTIISVILAYPFVLALGDYITPQILITRYRPATQRFQ